MAAVLHYETEIKLLKYISSKHMKNWFGTKRPVCFKDTIHIESICEAQNLRHPLTGVHFMHFLLVPRLKCIHVEL